MKSARHRPPLRYLAYGLLGMPLASTGWVLFLARLVDTVQDPWLGRCIYRLDGARLSLWMLAGALILALAFWGGYGCRRTPYARVIRLCWRGWRRC